MSAQEIKVIENIYLLQGQLNQKIGRDTVNSPTKKKYIFDYLLAFNSELVEFVDAWYDNDIQNLGVEIVDMLHFIISLAQCDDVSPEKFWALFYQNIDNNFNSSRIKNIVKLQVAMFDCIDRTNWKWWTAEGKANKRFSTILDEARLKTDLEKLIILYGSFCAAFGFDVGELYKLYVQKHKINLDRQEKNYSLENKDKNDCKEIK